MNASAWAVVPSAATMTMRRTCPRIRDTRVPENILEMEEARELTAVPSPA